MSETTSPKEFNLLSLDGGGAKGVYTLGVLKELEAHLEEPLHSRFQLIFGTSTGAIIAALIGLGKSIEEIERLYFDLIPQVMRHRSRKKRTKELVRLAAEIFGDQRFDAFKTGVAIVATNYEAERPLIFKTTPAQAYSLRATFDPGFGCTIAEAVIASAAAFPFFERRMVVTTNQGQPELIDGGFAANNPTLLAIADATGALSIPNDTIRVLSLGVGHYKEPQKSWYHRLIFRFWPFQMIKKMFGVNTNTIEGLRRILFSHIRCVRVDDSFPDDQYATDLLESDLKKLRKLFVLGRESFSKHEKELIELFPKKLGGQN